MPTIRHRMAKSQEQTERIPKWTAPLRSPPRSRSRKPKTSMPKDETINKESTQFLDLPLEVRDQIYSYVLLGYPSKKRKSVRKRKAVATTRRSLLSVCHQISEEYGPLYYRQVHVMVHARYPKATTPWRPYRCNPIDFGNLYLRTLAEYKLRNIRRLSYNATLLDMPSGLPDLCASVTWIDWSGLSNLIGILRKYTGILESLEELNVYVEPNEYLEEYSYLGTEESIWCSATEYGPWDEWEYDLVNDEGPLCCWKISRNIRVKTHGRVNSDRGPILVSFGSEFKKVPISTPVDDNWFMTTPIMTLERERYR